MKRHNSQSVGRQVKRGHLRFTLSEYLRDKEGNPAIIKERKTSRGKWILN